MISVGGELLGFFLLLGFFSSSAAGNTSLRFPLLLLLLLLPLVLVLLLPPPWLSCCDLVDEEVRPKKDKPRSMVSTNTFAEQDIGTKGMDKVQFVSK